MNVLVTGGAGFIGYNAAKKFKDEGHNVYILDKQTGGRNEFNWLNAKSREIHRIYANVNDVFMIKNLEPNIIVHCAAQTAVTKSLGNVLVDMNDNIRGTVTICEFARKHDSKLLFTSTNKVYGDNVNKITLVEKERRYEYAGGPDYSIDEMFPIDHTQHSPYGVSKLAADMYVQDYHYTYGLDTFVYRMSCIYGTDQNGTEDQGWVSHLVRRWVYNDRINIFGNGKQVRDLLHVDDLTKLLYNTLVRDNLHHGVFNIGGGLKNTISILELFDILESWESDYDKNNLFWFPWRAADQKVYISNISKAKRILNFYPEISPINGIRSIFNRHMIDKRG